MLSQLGEHICLTEIKKWIWGTLWVWHIPVTEMDNKYFWSWTVGGLLFKSLYIQINWVFSATIMEFYSYENLAIS